MSWQPISTAPRDNSAVLIWSNEADQHGVIIAHQDADGDWYDDWSLNDLEVAPTVWMPLPKSPLLS